MIAIALNRIYTPRQQVFEIVDFFLPMQPSAQSGDYFH